MKNLLAFKFKDNKNLKSAGIISSIRKLNGNLSLLDAISQLKQHSINFAIVIDEDSNRAMGMITLKKIFEKLVLQ
jgi:CBS domain containing-hemolysin-like protein